MVFAEEPAGDVYLVDALVPEVTVSVVPNPVPVVVEFLAEQVGLWGWAAPQVEVNAFGDGLRSTNFFDGAARFVTGSAAVFEFPEGAPFQPFEGGFESARGAALGPALDDAVVFEGGGGELASFPDGVGDWLFDVDVFPRLRGPDGGEGVPVVGGGNHHGVDVLVVEKAADVVVGRDGLSCVVWILFEHGFAVCDAFCIDVAECHQAGVFRIESVFENAWSASADADSGDADGIVGALCSQEGCGRKEGCGGCCGDVAEE